MTKESTEKQKAKRVESLHHSIDELRDKVKDDLDSDDMETFLTALAVKMIDETYARVGNQASVKERSHYGVSQWEPRHLSFSNGKVSIDYTGKKGVEQEKEIDDKKVVDALKEISEDKAKDECLFCWEDENGRNRRVSPTDINTYLDDFDITSKDIRGFHANEEMKEKLEEIRDDNGDLPDDEEEREEQLKEEFSDALDEVSESLGHKSSTLKNSYLVPHFEEEFLEEGKPPSDFFKESYFETVATRVVARMRSDKTADDIPETVERYVEEHEEQGMETSKSYALAWSRYCADNPDSPHCKQDDYFPNRPEVAEGIRSSHKSMNQEKRDAMRDRKEALRGDYSSGRSEIMDEWDKVQRDLGYEESLDSLLDWLGGRKAKQYLKHVTNSHSIEIDYRRVPDYKYKQLAKIIRKRSRFGANQLADALIKGMSIEEAEEAIEDMQESVGEEGDKESSVKKELIRLGSKKPRLQKHLRPVIARLEERGQTKEAAMNEDNEKEVRGILNSKMETVQTIRRLLGKDQMNEDAKKEIKGLLESDMDDTDMILDLLGI